MILYKNFQPSPFDIKGLGLPERQNWIVCPCMQSRDSSLLERCNFEAQLKILKGESETCEVHNFNHWGPGWIEICLVHPDRENEVIDLEAGLENYPVLDDDALSSMEYDEYIESWESYGCREFIKKISKKFDLEEEVSDQLDELNEDILLGLFEELIPSGDYYTHYSDGINLNMKTAINNITLSDIQNLLQDQEEPNAPETN